MRNALLFFAALAFVFAPGLVTAQCNSEGPIEPCHCLTMVPNPPVVGEEVTVALLVGGEPVQIGPEEEPICFGSEEDEICVLNEEGEDPQAVFNADGSVTFTWTQEMADMADDDGWAWVWADENAFEDDGILAEVPLADLLADGEGCSTCAGECGPSVPVPATGLLGLALIAILSALGGVTFLKRRAK